VGDGVPVGVAAPFVRGSWRSVGFRRVRRRNPTDRALRGWPQGPAWVPRAAVAFDCRVMASSAALVLRRALTMTKSWMTPARRRSRCVGLRRSCTAPRAIPSRRVTASSPRRTGGRRSINRRVSDRVEQNLGRFEDWLQFWAERSSSGCVVGVETASHMPPDMVGEPSVLERCRQSARRWAALGSWALRGAPQTRPSGSQGTAWGLETRTLSAPHPSGRSATAQFAGFCVSLVNERFSPPGGLAMAAPTGSMASPGRQTLVAQFREPRIPPF
jgi:hypothetical protein